MKSKLLEKKRLYSRTFYYTHTTAWWPLSTYIYISFKAIWKHHQMTLVHDVYDTMPKCWVFGCNISTLVFSIYLLYGASEYNFPFGGTCFWIVLFCWIDFRSVYAKNLHFLQLIDLLKSKMKMLKSWGGKLFDLILNRAKMSLHFKWWGTKAQIWMTKEYDFIFFMLMYLGLWWWPLSIYLDHLKAL